MTITIHRDVMQGTDAWHELRRGILTASEMHLIMTAKTRKVANNDKARAHMAELLAQRITGRVEPGFVSWDMERGHADEHDMRDIYRREFADVEEVGFITRDFGNGVVIGYSPDGLVGADGAIEGKSRKPKLQVATILADEMPEEYAIQVQTGLLVSGRAWIDFISYSAGLPMMVKRIRRDEDMIADIQRIASDFYVEMAAKEAVYRRRIEDNQDRFIATEWHPPMGGADGLVGADVED